MGLSGLVSKSQGPFQLHFPSAEITNSTTMPGFSMWIPRISLHVRVVNALWTKITSAQFSIFKKTSQVHVADAVSVKTPAYESTETTAPRSWVPSTGQKARSWVHSTGHKANTGVLR